ncbi:hypothetical protein E1B28_003999 [Marasmius oreades]|uniref:Uncharacterized protein n=1 Tax=Marasmius oreades TaxID=181124 RepID=A0A9P7UXR0_9AGAR|nr:uncharacterized protein E1B28_003999 [Marasmius oreades]KAG7096580.1 hypothetical protein E1B28_003999 [Marasmius oreades]
MFSIIYLLTVPPLALIHIPSAVMSISVEDLVCSFSSNHIGQEAMDLAVLQAQLAQAFFNQSSELSSSQKPAGEPFSQPCNTPTGRTPSTNLSWGVADAQRVNRRNSEDVSRELDDVEDERMVEDILVPSSPAPAGAPIFSTQPLSRTSRSHSSAIPLSPSSPTFVSDTSSFTSTDPFYLAQLQAMQTTASPSSVFTQLGRPSQQSPFVNQQQRFEPFGYSSSISLETRNMFATTSVALER